mgnify:FL=1
MWIKSFFGDYKFGVDQNKTLVVSFLVTYKIPNDFPQESEFRLDAADMM